MAEDRNASLDSTSPETDRRSLITGVAGATLAALLAAGSRPAQATSGIGYVGTARAQGADTPVGAKWWPSRWGEKDEAGASNWITPEKILDALKLVKTGKSYEMGRIYEFVDAQVRRARLHAAHSRQSDRRSARHQSRRSGTTNSWPPRSARWERSSTVSATSASP